MSSPSSLRHSVSETKFSPKSHMISSTSRSTTLPSKPSSSNTVAKIKLTRKGTDLGTGDELNNGHSLLSPYYKGLLDQSRAISPYYKGLLDQSRATNNEDRSQNHPQNHSNSGNNDGNNTLLSSSVYSPYYKGLIDFSLLHEGTMSTRNGSGEIAKLKKQMEEQKKEMEEQKIFFEAHLKKVGAAMKAREEEFQARESRLEQQMQLIMAHFNMGSSTEDGTSKQAHHDDDDLGDDDI